MLTLRPTLLLRSPPMMSQSTPLVSSAVRRVIFIVLPLMYLAGLIGLNVPLTASLFQILTPFNLVASLGLLLLFHTDFRPSFWAYCAVTFSVGFLVEVAGVHTGAIFGEYAYGEVLGFKIVEVPIIIGTNWLMLTYLCGSVTDRLPVALAVKVLIAAGLMTLLDFVIEPVAVRLDFWQWQGGTIPLQNYLAWYGISAVLFFLYFKMPFQKKNGLAPLLLGLQFLFFGLNSLWQLFD